MTTSAVLVELRRCPDCGGQSKRALKAAEKKAAAINGTPEPIISKGVADAAHITGSWSKAIAANCDGDNAIALNRQIVTALKDEDLAKLAAPTEEALMHSLALGCLDSAYEVETENTIAAPALPAPSTKATSRTLAVGDVTNRILGFSELPYSVATDQFLQLKVITRRSWDALDQKAKLKSFTIANATKTSMIETAQRELARQVARGADLRDFRKRVAKRMEQHGWTPANPSHVECLPADTTVSGAVVRAAHRRWHEGAMIEVVTASGRKFSTTPNHPMLTRRGWVASGELKQTDDLIGNRIKQCERSSGNHDVARPPALISEIFGALSEVGNSERVQCLSDDFHGDGTDGYVDVAHARGLLSFGEFTALAKPVENFLFAETDPSRSRFCSFCDGLIMITGRCGLCDRADLRATVAKDSSDSVAACGVFFSDLKRALAIGVLRNYLLAWQVVSGAHIARSIFQSAATLSEMVRRASFSDYESNPRFGSTELTRDRHHALPGAIEFDRVISIREYQFRGQVFNLSTESGYFQIDGIYTGNTIFRTNVQRSYTAGRVEHAMKPSVLRARPFWQIVTVNDGAPRQRATHRSNHGRVLRADNPIWKLKMMPWGFNCRCRFKTLAADYKGTISDDLQDVPDEGFTAGVQGLI